MLQSCDHGGYVLINDDGRDTLIQSDWEYPATASLFGWDIANCEPTTCPDAHCDSDGTVRCDCCGTEAAVFIGSAQRWLDDHVGDRVDNPGYFHGASR